MKTSEPTNEQRGIIPGVPTPEEFDPDLAGWTPGLPQTEDSLTQTALDFAETAGKVVGVLGSGVGGFDALRGYEGVSMGSLYRFIAFVATEIVDLAGIRPLGDDEQVGK